jgi:tetratricopeptide (TPR) repeat protein
MSMLRAVAPLLLVAVICGAARADDVKAAKEHFERGAMLYDLQRYAEAAREWEQSFENRNAPALLFNIGQAFRFAGEYQKAIGAYRSYLRRVPAARNRRDVEARITEMQALLDQHKQSGEKPPAGTITSVDKVEPPVEPKVEPKPVERARAPEPVRKPEPSVAPVISADTAGQAKAGRTKKIAGIVVAALGVALIGAGGGSYAVAVSKRDAIQSGPVYNPGDYDTMKLTESLGYAFFGIGGAAVVAGVVVAVLGVRQERAAKVALLPSLSPRHAGLSLHVGF